MQINYKKLLFLGMLLSVLSTSSTAATPRGFSNVESVVLPENMEVYIRGNTVINHPAEGFKKVILPTRNPFTRAPGGYIACYSKSMYKSAFGVGPSKYVMGQIRTEGRYYGKIFQPKGYENRDISAVGEFTALCNETFLSCKNGCWAGGDTGGWFGVSN